MAVRKKFLPWYPGGSVSASNWIRGSIFYKIQTKTMLKTSGHRWSLHQDLTPHGVSCTTPVKQSLALLAELSPGTGLAWLQAQRTKLEAQIGKPLSLVAVVSAAFHDLGLNPQQANMLYLILRLPGAAVHAMEQEQLGWKAFPAYGKGIHLRDDPNQDATS